MNAYLAKIEVSADDYHSFCARNQWLDVWRGHSYFGQYVRSFEELAGTKKKKTQKNFGQLPEILQKENLQKDFYEYVLSREYEKLKIFALVYNQTTLVVTAPADNDAQKDFLGYDWSNRKGAEGIQILKPGGKLYCDTDRYAPDNNIAAVIRSAFTTPVPPPADLEKYCVWHDLQDMIDFSRVEFNKEIKPSAIKKTVIKSKWPIVELSHIVSTIESGSRPRGGVGTIKTGVLSIGGEHIDDHNGHLNLNTKKYVTEDFYRQSSKGKILSGDILVCKDGA